MFRNLLCIITLAFIVGGGQKAQANLTILSQFASDIGTLVSTGYDKATNRVWLYSAFAAQLRGYKPAGNPIISLGRPEEAADDVDIEFAPERMFLGTSIIPANSLLFIT